MEMIVESGLIEASNSDVLNGTRLQTAPSNGNLAIELQASTFTSTDQAAISIQLPNGDTPLNSVPVPAGVGTGSLNLNDKTVVAVPIAQGGHIVIGVTVTGTVALTYRIVFSR